MKNLAASDNSSAVNLFPFLAVLLCTMGALLVLLIVMAQRAGQQAVSDESPAKRVETAHVVDPASIEEAERLERQLAEVRAYQEKIRALRQKSSLRLQDQQQKLTHLEEHARRLEEELAKLFLASEQLKATENNLVIDQQRAEREKEHLEQRIQETKALLEEMHKEAPAKKSYAIVPYKGTHGTFRRPIFVECSAEGVVLQPEGIRLKQEDFARPLGPGNPLAAALRAAREHLNAQAAQRGEGNLPDPYPLIVVRPDGILQYQAARRAIASWDADFGYVFVKQDLTVDFLQIDPQLAKAEYHAVLQAREMRRLLVRAAPSRYRGRGAGNIRSAAQSGSQGAGGTGLGGAGGDTNRYGTFAENGDLDSEFAGTGSGGSGSGGAGSDGSDGSGGDGDSAYGGSGGAGQGDGSGEEGNVSTGDAGQEAYANQTGGQQPGEAGEAGGSDEQGGGPNGQGGQDASGAQFAATGSAAGSSSGGRSTGSSAGSSGGSSSATGGSSGGSSGASAQTGNASPSLDFTKKQQAETSIAHTQGTDWAVRRSALAAVPIRRPIRVILRKDRLAILPEKKVGVHSIEGGNVISLRQPLKDVSKELATALRDRIDDWGLAGHGLYWRPVLVLNVGPEASQTATRLLNLLKNSGVEIQSPETARNTPGGHDHATR